ncbi:hypothetical protein ACF08M_02490 [Streptomyces sp. NPDC015032]|uniref:hypothetical protein n=1 Tax=Streptomyces sp. NPDC015032 TaxID=3364937 RepID=UPI0036F95264
MELFDDHSIVHGTDPVSDDFGGVAFDVPAGRRPGSGTIAQVAASTTGAVRVAVTTPANGPAPADV